MSLMAPANVFLNEAAMGGKEASGLLTDLMHGGEASQGEEDSGFLTDLMHGIASHGSPTFNPQSTNRRHIFAAATMTHHPVDEQPTGDVFQGSNDRPVKQYNPLYTL